LKRKGREREREGEGEGGEREREREKERETKEISQMRLIFFNEFLFCCLCINNFVIVKV